MSQAFLVTLREGLEMALRLVGIPRKHGNGHLAPRIPLWMLFVLLASFLVACGGSSSKKERLVIAIQPTQATAEMLEKAKPLERFLEEKLGGRVDVEVYVPLSQGGVIEALRFGQAQVAFMGAWPANLAVEIAGAELALAEVREVIEQGPWPARLADLHVWQVGRGKYAVSASVVTSDATLDADTVRNALAIHEELVHVTVEIHRS